MDELSPHDQVARAKREGAALRAGRRVLGWYVDRMADAVGASSFLVIIRNEQGLVNDFHTKMREILESRGVKFGEDGSVLGLSNDTMAKEEAGNDG